MVDDREYERWLGEARRALTSADVQGEAELHNWACFACEQAAQLALKALLRGIGEPAWGHDLISLSDDASQALEAAWPADDLRQALNRLSRHYIPARYPDAHATGMPGEHYGGDDVAEARSDAARIIDAVEAAWRLLREAEGDDE